jgi:HEAT repeat protein
MNSVILTIILFPLLQPIWDQEPFDNKNIQPAEAPTFLSETEIREQAEYYRKVSDPRLKSDIIKTLSQANNPYALKVFEDLLSSTDNQYIIEDILSILYWHYPNSRLSGSSKLKKFFKSENPNIRAYALALYFKNTANSKVVFEALETEESPFVIELLWKNLKAKPDKCDSKSLKKLVKSANRLNVANALLLLAATSADPDKEADLQKELQSPDTNLRTAIAQGILLRKNPGGDALMTELAKDKNSSVRALTAEFKAATGRELVHIALSKDSDWGVREAACKSLGDYKSPEAIDALIENLGDKYLQVRTTAENSLVKINPGAEFVDKIGKLLGKKSFREASVRTLGLLKAKKYEQQILKIIRLTKDPEIKARAIKALGRMDMKAATETICNQAEDQADKVRQAVAFALGKLKEQKSFATLVNLSKDKAIQVALEAVKSMGKIKNSYFNPRLYTIICAVRGKPQMRAAACWAIAKIGNPDAKTRKQLQALGMDRVIPTDMGEKEYDLYYVRASALFCLAECGKTQPKSHNDAVKMAAAFITPPPFKENFTGDDLKEYSRQASCYMKNQSTKPEAIKSCKPEFIVYKTKRRR